MSFFKIKRVGAGGALGRVAGKFSRFFERRKLDRETRFLQGRVAHLMNHPLTRERTASILSVKAEDPRVKLVCDNKERGLPGFFLEDPGQWWKMMLGRYAWALSHCQGKWVLDSCCGLAWGSFLIDAVAARVLAVDNDRTALQSAKALWPTRATSYLQMSVLELGLETASIDVALDMESIEHFSVRDIHRYLEELHRVLKPGGLLLGSSNFPETRAEALKCQERTPSHLYICTKNDIKSILSSFFTEFFVFHNRILFWAQK